MTKQILASLALVLVTAPAMAEKVTCLFTEPFMSVRLDTTTGRGKIDDDSNNKKVRFKNKASSPVEHGVEKWELASGYTLIIDRNQTGSDGMSDYQYPYSAQLNGNYGGCFTAELPRKEMGEGI